MNELEKKMMEYRVKGTTLGEYNSGKTSFLSRVSGPAGPVGSVDKNSIDKIGSTLGVGFFTNAVHIPETSENIEMLVKLYLWDTSGTERFRSTIGPYIRDSGIVFIVFDLTKRDSWERVEYWKKLALDEVKITATIGSDDRPALPLFALIGCKADQAIAGSYSGQITDEEIMAKAKEWKCPWWKMSNLETFVLRGTPTKFTARLIEPSYEMKLHQTLSGQGQLLSPREQVHTIMSEMVIRFHKQFHKIGKEKVNFNTCSLGTEGQGNIRLAGHIYDDYNDYVSKTNDNVKKSSKCCK